MALQPLRELVGLKLEPPRAEPAVGSVSNVAYTPLP